MDQGLGIARAQVKEMKKPVARDSQLGAQDKVEHRKKSPTDL